MITFLIVVVEIWSKKRLRKGGLRLERHRNSCIEIVVSVFISISLLLIGN